MKKYEELESIVVLIDAENAQPRKLKAVMEEISSYGRIVVKKAFGNWKDERLKNWEPELKRLAIKPEQQFAYTSGKNATDISLTIEAMDLLYTKIYDAFVLVSSDSDYTPLAIRLRESGVTVFGVGEGKTPEPFRNACDVFVLTQHLGTGVSDGREAETEEPAAIQSGTGLGKNEGTGHDRAELNGNDKGSSPSAAMPSGHTAITITAPSDTAAALPTAKEHSREHEREDSISYIHALLKTASEKYADGDGWVNVSSAGTYIKRVKPDFDSKSYGYQKLPDLIKAFPKKYKTQTFPGKGTVTIFAYQCK